MHKRKQGKCEVCGLKPAVVHITEIRNNKAREIHLCIECAAQKGFHVEKGKISSMMENLFTELGPHFVPDPAVPTDIECSHCGLTYQGFVSSRRFGCPNCYFSFEEPLKKLLKKIHGSCSHMGKIPRTVSPRSNRLKKQRDLLLELQKAVEEERYEVAARIRDEIKVLKREEGESTSEPEEGSGGETKEG